MALPVFLGLGDAADLTPLLPPLPLPKRAAILPPLALALGLPAGGVEAAVEGDDASLLLLGVRNEGRDEEDAGFLLSFVAIMGSFPFLRTDEWIRERGIRSPMCVFVLV
jgi:hypothetical protein